MKVATSHVSRLDPAGVDELRPYWDALRRHHAEIATGMPPVVDEATSWARRRALYETWLARPGSAAFLLPRAGYALVEVGGPSGARQVERSAELQTLSVLPEARGRGAGAALLAAVDAHLREVGAEHLEIGVAHGNDRARRFYERAGARPWSTRMTAKPFTAPRAPAGLTVERVPREGFEALAPLHAALTEQHRLVGPSYLPPQRPEAEAWRRAVAGVGEDAIVLAARDGGTAVGYAYATLQAPDDTWDTGPVGYLDALTVAADARGRGVGTALIAAAWGALRDRGAESFWLDVLAGNDRAVRLYERLGLRPAWHNLHRPVPPARPSGPTRQAS